ncbi:hypothetical protein FHX42_001225 [Saccharopolyspora lacisalsi]|uniref:Uncharacterized protein n=1 Tax=Halosaccharopolyspora lacisalsi TaxID=1000566 RepID=A0A839DUE7_9PSEU|nr:hypothetical protein [Halosaccharopolyspora lacisalsi]MBA8823896.1 hypothetical protein [Halosaccharopolyspora lacisalsi]
MHEREAVPQRRLVASSTCAQGVLLREVIVLAEGQRCDRAGPVPGLLGSTHTGGVPPAGDGHPVGMESLTELELEPVLLLVITTGVPLADGPAVLQLLWLLALVVGAWRLLWGYRADVNAPAAL